MRASSLSRETSETTISLELNLDGSGEYDILTGVRILDHFLSQLARHGLFDIKLAATGDEIHHLVEDVAIVLGRAFNQALGDKHGIRRFGSSIIPMDDALALVAVDIGGRSYAVIDLGLLGNDLPGLPGELVRHFLSTFANEARINLHARTFYGLSDHHKVEALFKALGQALRMAVEITDEAGDLPSTKGLIDS
jgi:imidazoleglycerol-phosphate dehydratase